MQADIIRDKVRKTYRLGETGHFLDVRIDMKGGSRELVSGWMPGRSAEDFAASALIQAVKPRAQTQNGETMKETQQTGAAACCDSVLLAACCEPSQKESCCGVDDAVDHGIAPRSCGCQDAPDTGVTAFRHAVKDRWRPDAHACTPAPAWPRFSVAMSRT